MANSKYEYVKYFENHEKCLPNCWIVVRVDGKGFTKFAEKHRFRKPNDSRSLELMTYAAKGVMKEFVDIVFAFGQSDEYSFLFKKDTDLFKRRCSKIMTSVCSSFTSNFVFNWPRYFASDRLLYPPTFDARVVLYPSEKNVRDYFSWRQVDVHINNLYNTIFWNLVLKKQISNQEAQERLNGTLSSEKNELLFNEFGINYNNEPEGFRKGTTIYKSLTHKKKSEYIEYTGDIIGDQFWNEHPFILKPDPKKSSGKKT